ncbi:MAG: hypothetical protein ABJK37_11005 [Paraglaciecola sp.]|uniref:hypothetical protein n=1 Tax=Paraglaciecola sp. TaxID=1920173 RepID=UPI00329A3F8C
MSYGPNQSNASLFNPSNRKLCSAGALEPLTISMYEIPKGDGPNEFPNIYRKQPALHQLAVQRAREYHGLRKFKSVYGKVQRALPDIILSLDETGKLAMRFTKPSSAYELITKAVADKLVDHMKGRLNRSKDLFSSQSASAKWLRFNAVLSSLSTLLKIRQDIDARNLVNEQYGARRREATNKKVRFCLAAIAANRIGTSQTVQYTNLYIKLWKDYEEFEKKLEEYLKWVTVEQKLSGSYTENQQFHQRSPWA